MEKNFFINKRNILITGLAGLALLATSGCATLNTLKNAKIEPMYLDSGEIRTANNEQEYDWVRESDQRKNSPPIYFGARIRF